MNVTELINLIVQNGFMTVFSGTILYFMYKFGNMYLLKLTGKAIAPLDNDLVLNLVRATVWYHSKGKLRTIEGILIENNIETRKDEITRRVRNCLEERTQIYLDYFNTLDTRLTRLGDVYGKLFEMEPFFKEVMEVVLRPYNSDNHNNEIAVKIKDVGEVMTEWQEKANKKLEESLKTCDKT